MTPEQLDEIEKLARDPKSAAFHDLMARQTIPLVKALREALDVSKSRREEAFDWISAYFEAQRERDEARAVADQCKDTIAVLREQAVELRAEVERLREVVGQVHALANEAVRGTAVWEPLVEIHEITKGMVE